MSLDLGQFYNDLENQGRIIKLPKETEEQQKARVDAEMVEFEKSSKEAEELWAAPDVKEWLRVMMERRDQEGQVLGYTFEELQAFMKNREEMNQRLPQRKKLRPRKAKKQ